MNPVLRLALVASALVVLLFVTRKIRKAQFSTADCSFWLLMSVCLLLVAMFPSIAYYFSRLLGIQSPANFIFLAVIALLLVREFTIQVQLTQLRSKVSKLCQEIALNDYDANK